MSDQHHEGYDAAIDQKITEEIADAGVAGGMAPMADDGAGAPGGLPIRTPQYGGLHWFGRVLVFAIPLAYLLVRVFGMTGIAGDGWINSGLGLLADAFIVAIAVMGVNLITGYTGQLSIGHAAFFAIGAYTGMALTEGRCRPRSSATRTCGIPGWTIPVAAAICFVVGLVVGLPALRLKGVYLALTTLVFVEAVRSVLKYEEFASVTGGATGIKGDKYTPPEYVFDFFGIKLPTGLDGRARPQPVDDLPVARLAAVDHADGVRPDAQPHRAGDGRHARQRTRRRGDGRQPRPSSRPSHSGSRVRSPASAVHCSV